MLAQPYKFGRFEIPEATVFASNKHSFAFTNLKCFRPGHVLVATKRVTPSTVDLEEEEVSDLLRLVKQVGILIRGFYNADSGMVIALQDGAAAGQTVPHVHFHVIPKPPAEPSPWTKPYFELLRHADPNDPTSTLCLETYCRSEQEQSLEASQYKAYAAANAGPPETFLRGAPLFLRRPTST